MKKNKKAFTLVELLGVIVILGILIAIISPTVQNLIEGSKERAYNTTIKNIEKACNDYLALYPNTINTSSVTIYLENLKKAGLVDKNLRNPKTNKLFSNLTFINITIENGIYKFDIQDSDIASSNINDLAPMINVSGKIVDYVEVNKDLTYAIPTCSAINPSDNSQATCTSLVLDDKTISMSSPGAYQILYEAINSYGKTTFTKTVILKDTTKPQITVENAIISLTEDEVENYLANEIMSDVVITDNSNDDLVISNQSNVLAAIGSYTIKYIASDSSGNSASFIRTVNVLSH